MDFLTVLAMLCPTENASIKAECIQYHTSCIERILSLPSDRSERSTKEGMAGYFVRHEKERKELCTLAVGRGYSIASENAKALAR